MRTSTLLRETNETQVIVTLDLDQTVGSDIRTSIPFFNHMLEQLGKHSGFALTVKASGDDVHHIVEDVGITLGEAFLEAIGDKKGIERYASMMVPMDESLINGAIDISGRPYLNFNCQLPSPMTSGFESELVKEFLLAFVTHAKITLHMIQIQGDNTHHIIENVFKLLARLLKTSAAITGKSLPSTKGVL